KATARQPTQSAFLTKPLNLSEESVGPNFKGHDIVGIVAELRRSPLAVPKSEFETTKDYEQRVKSLLASRDRQYAFVLNEYSVQSAYNADEKVMNVSITAPFVFSLFDSRSHDPNDPTGNSTYFSSHLELRSVLRSTSQYVATNGFGVKVNVT